MLLTYGHGTHVPCQKCGRKIFITEPVEGSIRNGKQWVELVCKSPACSAYGERRVYDEEALEIHGNTARPMA